MGAKVRKRRILAAFARGNSHKSNRVFDDTQLASKPFIWTGRTKKWTKDSRFCNSQSRPELIHEGAEGLTQALHFVSLVADRKTVCPDRRGQWNASGRRAAAKAGAS